MLVVEAESVVVESVVNGGVTTIVLEMMMVVTFTSGSSTESVSVSVCLFVVSDVDELGTMLSWDVIVALTNWRLTWRGK